MMGAGSDGDGAWEGCQDQEAGCGLATEMVVGILWPKSSICVLVNSLTHSFIHSFVQ